MSQPSPDLPNKAMDPSCLTTIRNVVEADSRVLVFLDFLKEFVPSLDLHDEDGNNVPRQLLELIVVPSDTCPVLSHIHTAKCREPAHTLVDDVVWLLGRQQQQQQPKKGQAEKAKHRPNVLSNGFVAAREGELPPAGMRHGIARSHHNTINESIGFCKTSQLMQDLHTLVGDEVFRLVLMHTRVFVPFPEQTQNGQKRTRGNYILLCGAPLPSPSFKTYSNIQPQSSSNKRTSITNATAEPRKKRRRVNTQNHTQAVLEKNLEANDTISRYALFYSDGYTPHVGLPSSHLFQREATTRSPLDVLNGIFGLQTENKNKQRRTRKRLGEAGLDISKDILKGHTRCDYHRLLERHCPLPDCAKTKSDTPEGNEKDRLAQLAAGYTRKEDVASFVGSVLRRVFPNEFWGSESNFQAVMTSVQSFVHLRRRERLANKNLMHGVRINQIKWLFSEIQGDAKDKKKHRSGHETASSLALILLRWVFRDFIIPLLRTSFFVTDTEFSANQVHYYRKPVWSLFRSLSVEKVLGGSHFCQISFEKALGLLKEHQMGISKLRLLPKATGVRPIAQLSLKQSVNFLVTATDNAVNSNKPTSSRKRANDDSNEGGNESRPAKKARIHNANVPHGQGIIPTTFANASTLLPHFLPTNAILGDVLNILRFECSLKAAPYGAGIDSLDFFYPKYREYVGAMKEARGDKDLGLTFASVDIEKCFDRIDQDTLIELLQNQLSHDGYVVQQMKLHDGTDKYIKGLRFKTIVEPLSEYRSMYTENKSLSSQNKKSVFDLYKCKFVERKDVLKLLEEHIRSNLVVTSGRFRKKVFHQRTGISQGSALSTILCNIYYGSMEQTMFAGEPIHQDDLLSRFVDDFLFISTSEENVKSFLKTMYKGVPDLGVKVNRDKSVVSTAMQVSFNDETMNLPNGCRRGYNGKALFRWCGLLFDVDTGNVSTDFERFHGGRPCNSLTVDTDGNEGVRMGYRVQGFVFPRCLPILFDSVTNSFDNIVVNFYQMMLFAGVKTAEYLRSLGALMSNEKRNVDHVMRCIEDLPPYAIQTINGRLNGADMESSKKLRVSLSLQFATWLTWKGFGTVFAYLSPEFSDICIYISAKLQHLSSLEMPQREKEIAEAAVSRGLDSMRLYRLISRAA